MRPSERSSASLKLWAPSERRFTPARRSLRSLSGEAVPGLASMVISASARTRPESRISPSSRSMASAGSSDGVPPPKKIVAISVLSSLGSHCRHSSASAERYALHASSRPG